MPVKKAVKIIFSFVFFALSVAFVIAYFLGYGLQINYSNSSPYYIFLSKPITGSIYRGEMIGFNHPKFDLHAGKLVEGLPGDQILVKDDIVFVNNVEIGPYQRISTSGNHYTVIDEGIIPNGHYFVSGVGLDSFDSRYKEFGLIESDWIVEILCPIF